MLIRRALAALLLLTALGAPAWARERVTVFAAASTTNAITEIARSFEAKGGVEAEIVTAFAASSALARQIEGGAPADLFLSADVKWMDHLVAQRLIEPGSRIDLLGNRLALIAPADSALAPVEIGPGLDLPALLGDGRLATGDPDHVPVGLYAKEALTRLGAWPKLENRLARAESVRAALAFVERGEAPLGIVYATDAAVTPRVKVLGLFPADSHAPITYPAALVAGRAGKAARAFLDFLKGPEARAVFEAHGFQVR